MALTRTSAECNAAAARHESVVEPFEALCQLTRDAVIHVDVHFAVITANRRARTLGGWLDQRETGMQIDELLPISSMEGERPGLRLRLSEPDGIQRDLPVLLRHASGRRIAVHVKCQRVADRDELAGWLFVLEPTFDEWRTQLWQSSDAPAFMGKAEFLQALSDLLSPELPNERTHALLYVASQPPRAVNRRARRALADETVLELCKLLKSEQHHHDLVARLLADEFVLLLHDTTLDQAESRARTLLREFGAYCATQAPDLPTRTLYIGIVAVPTATLDAHTLLQEAFDASQQAREDLTQQVCVLRSASTTLRRRREEIGWMAALSRALDDDTVELVMQPVTPIRDRDERPIIHEVSARLCDHEGVEIPSHRLLAAADRFQLLSTLDRWIVSTTLARLPALTTNGGVTADSIVAVRLSAASLAEPAMLAFLRRRVLESGVAPQRICFDIAETTALANALFATRLFAGLRQLGCQIALTDVGGSESSFAYLKNLPVHYLKLDPELCRGIVTQRSDRAMIEAIQRLAQVLSLKTIAKQVDDETVYSCLCEIGLDYVQGRMSGAPQPFMT
ncbi:MAG: EAL domain-containing protein [Steroidobacteraceae bacterium]|nr:EAL domain-containing protein [Steroidobacteraceae bacterium]